MTTALAKPSTAAGYRPRPAVALFENQLKALPDHQSSAVRERFFTASLAAALDSSLALRRRFVALLVGGAKWRSHVIGKASIDVELEVYEQSNEDSRYFLDLVLTINGEERIAVEVKLDAPEGVDTEGRRQLERYLRLSTVSAVAFVTASLTSVADRVVKRRDGRYLMPRNARGEATRTHFLWSDFYADVRAVAGSRTANPLVIALLGLFDRRGLQPAHPLVGELGGRTPFSQASPTIQSNRTHLQAVMQQVQADMVERGWSKHSMVRNNGTFYLYPPEVDDRQWQVWLSSTHTPGVFRVWFDLDHPTEQTAIAAHLERFLAPKLYELFGWDVMPTVLTPSQSRHAAVDVWLPYAALLRGLRTRSAVAPRVSAALGAVLDLADRAWRKLP